MRLRSAITLRRATSSRLNSSTLLLRKRLRLRNLLMMKRRQSVHGDLKDPDHLTMDPAVAREVDPEVAPRALVDTQVTTHTLLQHPKKLRQKSRLRVTQSIWRTQEAAMDPAQVTKDAPSRDPVEDPDPAPMAQPVPTLKVRRQSLPTFTDPTDSVVVTKLRRESPSCAPSTHNVDLAKPVAPSVSTVSLKVLSVSTVSPRVLNVKSVSPRVPSVNTVNPRVPLVSTVSPRVLSVSRENLKVPSARVPHTEDLAKVVASVEDPTSPQSSTDLDASLVAPLALTIRSEPMILFIKNCD